MTRPRAADDFAVIRARMEELKQERAAVTSSNNTPRQPGPRPYAASSPSTVRDHSGLAPEFCRALFPGRSA